MDANFCTGLIAEVGQAILMARDLPTTVALILEKALELSGAQTSGLMELDRASGWLRYTHGAGRDGKGLLDHVMLRPGEGVVGRAMELKAPFWSTDVEHDD